MAYITTNDGAELFYETRGSGQALVFVGGWCMSTFWWQNQLESLSDTFQCVAYDPRAYGRSSKVDYGHRIARHARDLYDVLIGLDLSGVIAVGWSTGAAMLLAYSEAFRDERLSAIVLVEQSPCNVNRDDWEWGFGSRADADAFIEGIAADHRTAASELVDAMFTEPVSSAERELMIQEITKMPAHAAAELERDDFNQDWRDVLPRIRVPALVVAGAQSRIFPNAGLKYMADRIPVAQFVTFARSGHCPFMEEPERFNLVIRGFVSEIQDARIAGGG